MTSPRRPIRMELQTGRVRAPSPRPHVSTSPLEARQYRNVPPNDVTRTVAPTMGTAASTPPLSLSSAPHRHHTQREKKNIKTVSSDLAPPRGIAGGHLLLRLENSLPRKREVDLYAPSPTRLRRHVASAPPPSPPNVTAHQPIPCDVSALGPPAAHRSHRAPADSL
ncbi:hypothetical protein chiPu_0023833 [Chiloscyllium punctatum]|uniref:Uncharacterized protein n=1 Tax=Chiloscyllium punctatum TaxID=137246 RepID=A0A401T9Z3_CHIPU|nr:hypothetical protein [Chiloscyllium punctatum]